MSNFATWLSGQVCFLNKLNSGTEQDAINPQLSSVEKEQIVAFQTGGEMVHASKPNISMDQNMLKTATEDREHGLKDFLARPIPVFSGTWTTSQAVNTILPSSPLTFPQVIWAQPMWANKLKGFRFLRPNLKFQIQVNASPFDQGRLLAFWSPFDAERGDLRPIYSRTNWTGYPCVEVDVGNQMTAELEIPYVSMFSAIDQTQPNQPYGIFRLGVLSPFNSANDTSVDVTVYCWMSHVDISIPTDFTSFGMVGQSGKVNEAYSRSKLGLISGGSKMVGDAARMFANTPGISGVAKPVAWMSDVVGGAASLLGFSKPTSDMAVQTIANVPGKSLTNYDGLDNSVVIGTSHKNEIEHKPDLFGTTVDEMSIAYIISKWNYFQSFNWSTAAPAKSNALFKLPIHPGICGTDVPPGTLTGTWYTPTQLAFVASMFRYWRGGISLRFSAVKNQYYSGRLVFVYYPGVRAGEVIDYTTLDVSNCYKWIWDIRQDSDLELTIPYNANTQYLRVRMHNNADSVSQEGLGVDTITGTLVVFVDNQLRGPATVPDNFWVTVWVRGASDTTFAAPDCVKYGPYFAPPTESLLPSGFGAKQPVKIRESKPVGNYIRMKGQMMKVESTFDVNQDRVGKANQEGSAMLEVHSKENISPELFCSGEVINNLRVLTRRFGFDYAWTNTAGGTENSFTIDPAFFFSPSAPFVRNPINYIARLFVFYKGSMRYKIMVNGATPAVPGTKERSIVTSSEVISSSPRSYTIGPANPYSISGGRFLHIQYTDINPILEVTLPYYSNVPMQVVSKTYITSTHLRMIYKYLDAGDFSVAEKCQGFVYKAGADDFTFGYLAGAPLLLDYTEV